MIKLLNLDLNYALVFEELNNASVIEDLNDGLNSKTSSSAAVAAPPPKPETLQAIASTEFTNLVNSQAIASTETSRAVEFTYLVNTKPLLPAPAQPILPAQAQPQAQAPAPHLRFRFLILTRPAQLLIPSTFDASISTAGKISSRVYEPEESGKVE